jgi:hypothetical protein
MTVRDVKDERLVILVSGDNQPYADLEGTGLDKLNGRILLLLHRIERANIVHEEIIIGIKPLETKVFTTHCKWKTRCREDGDYQQWTSAAGRQSAPECIEGMN